jgi:Mg-chelatase subunit ChlD
MNPNLPPSPREELEAKVTALLLGELSADEAASVRELIAKDAELARLRDRLSLTMDLLRETAATPVGDTPAQPAPLKLSPARREKLLAHFKTIAPKEFAQPSRRKMSWLIPLAAAALFVLFAVITNMNTQTAGIHETYGMPPWYSQLGLPNVVKARTSSQQNAVINNLRLLDAAKQEWALEMKKSASDTPTMKDLQPYFGHGGGGELPQVAGERYYLGAVGQPPVAQLKNKVVTLQGEDGSLAALNQPAMAPAAPLSSVSPVNNSTLDNLRGRRLAENNQAAVNSANQIVLPQDNEQQLAVVNNRDNSGVVQLEKNNGVGGGGGTLQTRENGNREQPRAQSAAPVMVASGSSKTDGIVSYEMDRINGGSPNSRSALPAFAGRLSRGEIAAADKPAKVTRHDMISGSLAMGDIPHAGSLFKSAQEDKRGTLALAKAPEQSASREQAPGNAALPAPVVMSIPLGIETAKEVSTVGGTYTEDLQRSVSPASSSGKFALDDAPLPRPSLPAPVPQAEVMTRDNAFTTFSLNVSDVAFKLAAASLQNGAMPEAASMRSEEFINAFDYRDPEPAPGAPIGFAWERAGDPFAHNRDLLRFSVKTAAQGRQAGRPLNLVLLLDKSGSMERADRVEIISQALSVLASQLEPQDTLSVVVFARTARLFVDGVSGSQAGNVAKDLRSLTPEGGTNLEEAMKLAYAAALRHYLANGENRVVLMTDGAANLGNVEPDALKKTVETNRKQGIALDCFGIGWDGYNDNLLETLSRAGNGRYGFINTPEEAATEFAGKLAGALRVAAADVKVQVEFNPNRVKSYRQIGYAKDQLKKEDFRDNSVRAAQIGAAESGNALYTVEINPAGEGPLGMVHVRFRVPGTSDYQEHEWTVPYTGGAVPLDKASPAMRLTATAAAFCEWLAGSPHAGDVTPDRLLGYLNGVPKVYGADARPAKLEWMIRQARSISGK